MFKKGLSPKIYKVKENLTAEEANKLEIDLIAKIGRKDLKLGSLLNLCDGGQGLTNMSRKHKNAIRKRHKGKINSQETLKKMSDAKKGKPKTLQHRLNLSKSIKGSHLSKKTKDKLKDKRWVTNGKKSICIKKENLESYIKNGWSRGRHSYFSEATKKLMSISAKNKPKMTSITLNKLSRLSKNTVWINNRIINKMVKKYKIKQYLKDGWIKGKIGAKEKHWMNDGNKNKAVHYSKINEFLSNGWMKGPKKMELKAEKVLTNDSGKFDETLKFKVLMCGNPSANNNKFYCLELQKSKDNEYRIFSHYGRLCKTNVYDERISYEGKPITNFSLAEKEFDRIITKKCKGKKLKDEDTGEERIEKYVEVETVKPNVGSTNICNKSIATTSVKVSADTQAIKQSFKDMEHEVSRLVNQIVEENIHNITSLTTFKLTASGFETPLGPVTQQHVDKARIPLNELKNLLKNSKLDQTSKAVAEFNTAYFSLIPHQFGHKILQSDWILDENKLANEYDLLDQLSSAVTMGSSLSQGSQQKLNALGSDIEVLKDKKKYEQLEKYVENSKASNHKHIWQYKVKNIFKIKIPTIYSKFESQGKKYGNIKELFHGSRNCNVLSILKNGLIIPPCNAPGVTGRMFSDGLYFASNSTKSLNYSLGSWQGTRNKFKNTFLFIADVAMGKAYEAYSPCGPQRGYDSVHAIKGQALQNDEYIVYSLEQHNLSYLIELSN